MVIIAQYSTTKKEARCPRYEKGALASFLLYKMNPLL
nr:MAG TPA: hypothetical protein [Caudoviricetes sp.]